MELVRPAMPMKLGLQNAAATGRRGPESPNGIIDQIVFFRASELEDNSRWTIFSFAEDRDENSTKNRYFSRRIPPRYTKSSVKLLEI